MIRENLLYRKKWTKTNFLKQKSLKPKVKYDIIKTLSHGYCTMGPIVNAIRAVPPHPMGHFPWDSHGNPIPMDKPGFSTT